MKMNLSIKYFGAVVISLAMITAATSVMGQAQNLKQSKCDAAPMLLADRVTPSAPLMDPGDVLFEHDAETPTGDNQCLGVEFDGTYFWVTGGNASNDPNKLYKFDTSGNLISTYNQPGHSESWGWRDLTFDGTYLYASVDNFVDQIDPATGTYTGTSLPGPESPNRALAYDPVTDHFWTANFRSAIYEFARDGTIINTFAQPYPIYGLAWDDVSEGGPWLWVYDQEQENDHSCHIRQFDPVSGEYTGVEFTGVQHNPGYGTGFDMAGGAAFYEDGGVGIFVGLTQNTPDLFFGMDVTQVAAPNLEIIELKGGFGASATIKNVGDADATNIEWSISLDGGVVILGKNKTGTITTLAPDASEQIKTGLVFGFGKPTITVAAESDEGAIVDGSASGLLLLFFLLGVS
jgi:hypothetical protein